MVAELDARGGDDVAEGRGRDVEPAAADLVGRLAGQWLGRADQRVADLCAGPVGVLLRDDGGCAGDVRGRHRGARQRDVGTVAVGGGGAGGEDVDAGCDDLGLHHGVAQARAHVLEVGALVRAVDCSDGERGLRGAGRADAADPAVVAGGDDEERARRLAERVDGEGHRVGAVAGLRAAQAHRDDVGAAGAPLHPLDDPGLRAGACVVEDLADREVRAGRDALLLAVGGGAGAGHRRGDVGAVAVDVGDRLPGHEAAGLGHLLGEVGVGLVDAGVEHGDGDAGAVEALRPRLGGADLRDGVGERGLDLAVEVDLGDAAGEAGFGPLARSSQKSVASSLLAAMAAPPMLGSTAPWVLWAGASTAAARTPGPYWTISGIDGTDASSYPCSTRPVTLKRSASTRPLARNGSAASGTTWRSSPTVWVWYAAGAAGRAVDAHRVGACAGVGQGDDVAGEEGDLGGLGDGRRGGGLRVGAGCGAGHGQRSGGDRERREPGDGAGK